MNLFLFLLLLVLSLLDGKYVEKCRTRYFDQPKDHFVFPSSTYKQRVLFNLDEYKLHGPIFFYLGNEANVELYVEHTGLMWENARKFGAAIVFAEHRYYGESILFNDKEKCDMSYLTTEQALRDYAIVVDTFKRELQTKVVIGFGGSYGGMLATVFRYLYPHIVDGVIAGSAPVLAYQELNPPYDSNGFARVVTKDAGPICAKLVKAGFIEIYNSAKTMEGREILSKKFRLCKILENEEEAMGLLNYASSVWDYLAMGDFPYESNYVQPDGALLPAYPIKAACKLMVQSSIDPVLGLSHAANLFYNASSTKTCNFNQKNSLQRRMRRGRIFKTTPTEGGCQGNWDYQWCTEHNMPFTSGTDKDMFYPDTGPFNLNDAITECQKTWGVQPNPFWAKWTYDGIHGLQKQLTNVVFSNGLLDPWSAGGVLNTKNFHPSVIALKIPHGAHHVDLMFSHEKDPWDVKIARMIELIHIQKWISQAENNNMNHETNTQKVRSEIM